ncbi:uncharacterized protein BO72DRAFT_444462 [Aspergillus fijiensis CBS 313.89]|uniref:Uncharacterized protein n=1 Tax=Aspergillus fijiensis CBS 313.89 TaxID=1448319 RepID=A0A8G1W1Y0_9EURO|nr:uncharacterized protein BO72DRAFT_444462 [Aspergillus fijiensis CBS 313.89]RAK81420.1 hypothetical protein BO72DRAFT_444462 [Aspergillus fijiensis CBS 313.89]
MSDTHASKRSRTDLDGNAVTRSVEPDDRNANNANAIASPHQSAVRSDPRPRSCSPMPDLAEYIRQTIDEGGRVKPRVHAQVKRALRELDRPYSFDVNSELVAKKLEIVHPRLNRWDRETVFMEIYAYLEGVMEVLVAKCALLADDQMRYHGLSVLLRIGRMLVSVDERPGDVLHGITEAVADVLRRAMLIILAGLYVFPLEDPESSWEKLYEEVEDLDEALVRKLHRNYGLHRVLHHLERTFTWIKHPELSP